MMSLSFGFLLSSKQCLVLSVADILDTWLYAGNYSTIPINWAFHC